MPKYFAIAATAYCFGKYARAAASLRIEVPAKLDNARIGAIKGSPITQYGT